MGEGVAGGLEPEGDVRSVGELGGGGVAVAGGVEVVDGEEGEVEAAHERRDTVEPEAGVASGAMEDEDGGMRAGCVREGRVKADRSGVAGEGELHGDEMVTL